MKSNRPSLFLYFAVCILVVFFKILRWDDYVLYSKSIIIPLLFIYYFIVNNYKINRIKALIFFVLFYRRYFQFIEF